MHTRVVGDTYWQLNIYILSTIGVPILINIKYNVLFICIGPIKIDLLFLI